VTTKKVTTNNDWKLKKPDPALFWRFAKSGKALHRGQPADHLWASAISATERWMALAR
jgi:hypothetical protein